MNVGDHVEVGSLIVKRARIGRPPIVATGRIVEFTLSGVIVHLDQAVNGILWCSASRSELTVIP